MSVTFTVAGREISVCEAMIEAYLDESGTHEGADVCVIAGYWGLKSQWKWFRKRWQETLAAYGVPLEEFHATEMINNRRHEPMMRELADVISRYPLYPVTVGVVVPDFLSFNSKQREFFTGATLDINPARYSFSRSGAPTKPYFVPFGLCLRKVTDRTKPGHRANFFFGVDTPTAKYAKGTFKELKRIGVLPGGSWYSQGRLGEPFFPLAKDTPELQAADLLVHLTYRHMRGLYVNGRRAPATGLLARLLTRSKSPQDHQYFDQDGLAQTLKNSHEIFGEWDA